MEKIRACDLVLDTEEVIKNVNEVLRSSWISASGPVTEEFEQEFAKYIGMKHAIAVTNGTVAIHLALVSMGISHGDEVIMPAFAPIFCSNPIFWCGAKPVLVDVDSDTLCIDANKIEEKITPKTKVIMAIHMYGHPCDMDTIKNIAEKYGLKILEDSAEAHGSVYKDKVCGSMGDVAIFSFYSNKLVRSGEGGMLVTNDDEIAIEARRLRSHYSDSKEWKFRHAKMGFNYRLSDVLSAIALVDLRSIDERIKARRTNAYLYKKYLANINVKLPVEKPYYKSTFWMYNIILPSTAKRQAIMDFLESKGIETRPSFFPVHLQPCYNDYFINEKYPVSEHAGLFGMNLPSGNTLKEEQIGYICWCLKEAIDADRS